MSWDIPSNWERRVCDCGAPIVLAEHSSGNYLHVGDAPPIAVAQVYQGKDGAMIKIVNVLVPHRCPKRATPFIQPTEEETP